MRTQDLLLLGAAFLLLKSRSAGAQVPTTTGGYAEAATQLIGAPVSVVAPVTIQPSSVVSAPIIIPAASSPEVQAIAANMAAQVAQGSVTIAPGSFWARGTAGIATDVVTGLPL